jgi:SsrA-binding protein
MILLDNKKARFDYEILETFSAGLVLAGWEVKSLRTKNGSLRSAWIKVRTDGLWLENAKIPIWPFSSEAQEIEHPRKLLLKKKEIERLNVKVKDSRATIIPLKIFTKGPHIKCEIALAQGRRKHEKKQVLKDRATKREAQHMLKAFNNR